MSDAINFVEMVKCNDHRWWDRFAFLCREHLANMRTDDMDLKAMRYVVEKCHSSRDVWRFIRQYKETYFRELIQTLESGASKHIDPWFRRDYQFYRSFFVPRRVISRSPRRGTFKVCLSNSRRKSWTNEYYVPSNRLDIE